MSLTHKFKDQAASDLFRRIVQAGGTGRKVVAHVAARTTQDHFAELGRRRHRGGSSNYYANAARATTGRVLSDSVVVSIDHAGIALRRYGGTIKPGPGKKFLAIPDKDNVQAQNNSPGRITGLHFRQNHGKPTGRLTDNTGRVFYWLVKKTTHKPDPDVLPTDEDFAEAIIPELKHHMDRI